MSENPPKKRKYTKHSIKNLRLDLEAAELDLGPRKDDSETEH